jgi:histidinol-phosphate aminotransferase
VINPQVPEYIRSLAPYVPGKPIEETQREFKLKRVIKLASNENPLGPSPKALAALRGQLRELHRYPDSSAFHLKAALGRHLKVEPGAILVGNGSNDVIDMLVRTFCVPGDAIATAQAAFVAYRICAQIHGVRTLEAPLTRDLRFDLPAIARLVREDARTKIVFIANPNNPTGTHVTGDELRAFLREVSRLRGGSVLVALDYAYWEYVTARDLPDAMELYREFPNVVVLRTFSKAYGLAGLRVGYGVARPELVGVMEKIRQPFNLNSLALVAATAALGDRAFVARARKANGEGLRFWQAQLRKLGIPFWPSQGNFLLADVQAGMGRRGVDVYQGCLRRGVIFRPVANYGLHGALRISIGTKAENAYAARALGAEAAAARGGSA